MCLLGVLQALNSPQCSNLARDLMVDLALCVDRCVGQQTARGGSREFGSVQDEVIAVV